MKMLGGLSRSQLLKCPLQVMELRIYSVQEDKQNILSFNLEVDHLKCIRAKNFPGYLNLDLPISNLRQGLEEKRVVWEGIPGNIIRKKGSETREEDRRSEFIMKQVTTV